MCLSAGGREDTLPFAINAGKVKKSSSASGRRSAVRGRSHVFLLTGHLSCASRSRSLCELGPAIVSSGTVLDSWVDSKIPCVSREPGSYLVP
jgi:hypothetical protein